MVQSAINALQTVTTGRQNGTYQEVTIVRLLEGHNFRHRRIILDTYIIGRNNSLVKEEKK